MVALPFCFRSFQIEKPKNPAYPKELNIIGAHIRKRRLDFYLLQSEVTSLFGVCIDSVGGWEFNHRQPNLHEIPKIIEFLGYDQHPRPKTMGEELFLIRSRRGITAKQASVEIGVDQTAYARWKRDERLPLRNGWSVSQELAELTQTGGITLQAEIEQKIPGQPQKPNI